MAYSTVEDFIVAYPKMEKSNVSSATMYTWIQRASDYIDSEIFTVVESVPVAPTPPLLRALTEDVAFVMFLRRNVMDTGKNPAIENLWKDVTIRLDRIRNGYVTLVTSGTEISTTGRNASPWSNVQDYTPVFGQSNIEDAQIDPDRLDDEEDARD